MRPINANGGWGVWGGGVEGGPNTKYSDMFLLISFSVFFSLNSRNRLEESSFAETMMQTFLFNYSKKLISNIYL